jgi:hypothetical protein
MATTTTNFGWDIPQSTDLVKDGATAIAALGQDIDTAFIDLKGGTTGQVLAKASGTDLDFSWVAQDDSNAIQNAIVDAKGDLIGATAADTPARLAVGTNGQVLTADSAEATGLKWATPATATSGLTLITTSSPSAASTVSINSCFSSTYQSYQIHYNLSSTAVSSLNIRLRASGTDATTNYIVQTFTVRGGTTAPSRDATGGKFIVGAVRTSGRSYGICNISNPFEAAETSTVSQAQDPETSAALDFRACAHTTATSYDGFTFYTDSGTFTGSIRVYGVQNS